MVLILFVNEFGGSKINVFDYGVPLQTSLEVYQLYGIWNILPF